MATVNLSWGIQNETIPNAATFTQYEVKLVQGVIDVATAIEPLGSTSHTFLNIPPGDYVASVAIEDPAGNDGAPPVTVPFTVPVEATAPVPVSIDVVLS